MSKYYGNDNFNLQNAYDDCKLVFEGITDEESYQKADRGLVMYYANEIMYALEKALEERPQGEWEDHSCSFYFCSNCGMGNNNAGGYRTRFCPNCGADMRKGEEE